MHTLLHKTLVWRGEVQELHNNKVLANKLQNGKRIERNKTKGAGGQRKKRKIGFSSTRLVQAQAYPHAAAVESAVRDHEGEHGMTVVV